MDLKLWHGLNLDALKVLGLSLLTLASGLALYRWIQRPFAGLAAAGRVGARLGPTRLFEGAVDALPSVAGSITAALPIGRLRHAVLTAVVVAVAVSAPWLLVLGSTWSMPSGPPPTVHEGALAVLAVAGAVLAARSRSRLAAVVALGVTGLAVALLFVVFGAPDLAMTQIAVETLSVIVLVLVFAILPAGVARSGHGARLRDAAVAVTAGVLMAALVLVAGSIAAPTDVPEYYLERSVPEAYGRNVVNVILVDFRALDTLGEIVVVTVAGLGIAALLSAAPAVGRRRDR
jgi:multicomponent Na+:H+ antiporter subunit A